MSDNDLFTLDSDDANKATYVSPALAGDGTLRCFVQTGETDWWATEFNIDADGKIIFRDYEGDELKSTNATKDQTLSLNFKEMTGELK